MNNKAITSLAALSALVGFLLASGVAPAQSATLAAKNESYSSTYAKKINPHDLQRPRVDFNKTDGMHAAYFNPSNTVLHASRKKKVGKKGSIRAAFSTGVTVNKRTRPTRVTFDGESQGCLYLPKKVSSIKLTDKFTVRGISLSASAGGGISVSGSPSKKTITVSHTKKKPKRNGCINNVARGITVKGIILGASESATATVKYRSTKYTIQAGVN